MNRKLTLEQLQHTLDTRDNGVLSRGSHQEDDRAYCALEAVALTRGIPFTDDPYKVGMPDVRRLNDGLTDINRTRVLLPLLAALSDWNDWSTNRQRVWTEMVVIGTVNQIISALPGLPPIIQQQCQNARSISDAEKAAAAARAAARAAEEAAEEAAAAAEAAAAEAAVAAAAVAVTDAARDATIETAVTIWLQAVEQTVQL